uniref:Uncharacterized protein n=1 Tax=Candidatus Kentrum eta TaxID=2126337 RepID=A0A450V0K3_9GAMM|nr:MAG: hypothetical protein BECKH772A_GA0070896_1002226 [Candidatus Kentron sp. H]VFJ91708.1 MAG: hypothetical protein BECKH772B_GA0070898_1002026 [Candidatus Kentron sp. H]VFJ98340.1 MAG: hypothetical protein BECKH772C_GA0070978_1002026 [Candidatus Kentron sp. H]
MQFLDEESKILDPVRNMARGLTDNSLIYPSPAINVLDLGKSINACERAKADIMAAQSVLKQAFDAKDTAMVALTEQLKRNIRYAENTVGNRAALA